MSVEIQLSNVRELLSNYGEMLIHENAVALTIDSVSKEHAVRLFGAGHLKNFTFDAGSTGAIANTANNGSGLLRITHVGHGRDTADILTTTGLATAAQNDVTSITKIDDDTFDCDDISFVSAGESGTWNQGSYLLAGANTGDDYHVNMGMSASSSIANKIFEWHLYVNTTRQIDSTLRQKFPATDVESTSTSSIVTIAVGDKIWWAVAPLTDAAADITHIHANVNLHLV